MKDAAFINKVPIVFFLGWVGWLFLPTPISEPHFWYLIPPLVVWAFCVWIAKRLETEEEDALKRQIQVMRQKDKVWDAGMKQYEQDLKIMKMQKTNNLGVSR